MPIRRRDYHPHWAWYSYYIRHYRAGNRCERCGVRNHSVGRWEGRVWVPLGGNAYLDNLGAGYAAYREAREWVRLHKEHFNGDDHEPPYRMVVLTVAHLDQDRRNNDFRNLAALCQRCHLAHDRAANAARRKYGRRAGSGQTSLWDGRSCEKSLTM